MVDEQVDSKIPTDTSRRHGGCALVAACKYTVTGGSRHLLRCDVSAEQLEDFEELAMVEPDDSALSELGLLASAAVCDPAGRVPVVLLNMSNFPVTIEKGTKLAQLVPIGRDYGSFSSQTETSRKTESEDDQSDSELLVTTVPSRLRSGC